jgi:hypothetical protein
MDSAVISPALCGEFELFDLDCIDEAPDTPVIGPFSPLEKYTSSRDLGVKVAALKGSEV